MSKAKSSLIKILGLSMPSVLLAAPAVYAQIDNPIKSNTINELLTDLLTIMIDIAVVVSVLAFIFAGLKMVMARGNPEEINTAKSMIWYTAVGAAISIGAKSIQLVIQNTIDQI